MLVAHHSNGRVPVEVSLTGIDLGSWDFWALDDEVRDGVLATLRREAPVRFFPQLVRKGEQPGAGHWALTSQPRTSRDQRGLPGSAPSGSRHRSHRGTSEAAVCVPARDQTPARTVDSAADLTIM